jgi:hypothetical protein
MIFRLRLLVALAATGCGAATVAAAPLLQAPASVLPVPATYARLSTLLDVDGDGRLDVAVGSSQGLQVFRRLADGTYAAPVAVLAGDDLHVIAAGRANADGSPDLVVTQVVGGEYRLRSLLNAAGTLVPSPGYVVPPSGSSRLANDFDGDTLLDVLSYDSNQNLAELYTNDGAGGFVLADTWTPVFEGSFSVRVADLDEDGDPDVILGALGADNSDSMAVYLNDGDGTFAAPLLDASRAPIALGDFDGLGGLDGLFSPSTLLLNFRSGNGAGGFGPPVSVATNEAYLEGVAGDMDADGDQDLASVLITHADVMRVDQGHGDGTFTHGLDYPTGAMPLAPRVGDLDGEGSLDVLVPSQDDASVNLYVTQGDGTFGDSPVPTTRDVHDLALADLDLDGDPDLVSIGEITGGLSRWRNPGDGGFVLEATPDAGVGPLAVVTGRVDGDLHPDVLVTNSASQLKVFRNDGSGALLAPTTQNIIGQPRSIASGDLDGDSDLDLVLPSNGPTAQAWLGDGLGGFSPGATLLASSGSFTRAVLARFDAGATLDLALANGSQVLVYAGLGNGSFGLPAALPITPGTTASTLEAADADGDGDVDLFAVTSTGIVARWRNQGGTLTAQPDLDTRPYPAWRVLEGQDLRVRDFDGDGAPDLCVAPGWQPRAVGVFDGTVPGSFAPVRLLGGFYAPRAMDTGDVDGDGDLDLVLACMGSLLFQEPGTIVTLVNRQNLVAVPAGPGRGGPGAAVSLAAPWPVPAQGAFSIRYRLAADGPVRVELVAVDGRRVVTIDDAPATAGEHTLRLGGGPALAAGVYAIVVTQAGERAARKIVLLP